MKTLIQISFAFLAANTFAETVQTYPVAHGGKKYTLELRGPDFTRGTFVMPETGVRLPVWKYQTQTDCGPHCLGRFVNARDARSSGETIGLSLMVYEKESTGGARAEVTTFETLHKMSGFNVEGLRSLDDKRLCYFNAWDVIPQEIKGVPHSFHISTWCQGREIFLVRRDPKTNIETGLALFTYSGPIYDNRGYKMDAIRIGDAPKEADAKVIIEIIWDSDLGRYQIDFLEKPVNT